MKVENIPSPAELLAALTIFCRYARHAKSRHSIRKVIVVLFCLFSARAICDPHYSQALHPFPGQPEKAFLSRFDKIVEVYTDYYDGGAKEDVYFYAYILNGYEHGSFSGQPPCASSSQSNEIEIWDTSSRINRERGKLTWNLDPNMGTIIHMTSASTRSQNSALILERH